MRGLVSRGRSVVVCLSFGAFVACSQAAPAVDEPDASQIDAPASTSAFVFSTGPVPMPRPSAGGVLRRRTGETREEHPALTRARTIVAMQPGFEKVLDDATLGLSLEPEGFVSEAWRKPSSSRGDLIGSVLPHRANEPWRSSPGRTERWAMSLEPIGVNDVVGELDGGRVVYTNALHHADIIGIARDREVEQLVLLKDKEAPTELRWRVHLGSDLRPRVLATGAIDFLDGKGEPALRVQRPFAIDAVGKYVDVEMKLERDQLTVKLDASSLTYPVLLDPVVEVPIWVNVTPVTPTIPAAMGVLMMYSSGISRTLLIGGTTVSSGVLWGSCPGSYNSTIWQWNGSAWSAMGGVSSTLSTRWRAAGSDFGAGAIVFGGQNCTGGGAGPSLADTWTLSGSTWTQRCVACAPPAESDGQMAYLAGTGAVMFSGQDATAASYIFNAGPDWTKVAYGAADTANGMIVPRRERAAMSADPVSNKVYISGGFNVPLSSGTAVPWADMWQYDPTATGATFGSFHWRPTCGVGALIGCPFAPRASHGMVYDAGRKKHIIFGGETNKSFPVGSTGFKDTWEFDSATGTYSQLCSTCAPVRWVAPLAYDSARGRIVTASSMDYSAGSLLNETWELHVRGGTCSVDADCDTGHCIEGTCCESICPVCQTCVAPSSPGVCSNVLAGVSDPLSRCAGGGQCNGSGACRNPLGTACTLGTECATGFCVNSVCCSTSACGVGFTCSPSGSCKKLTGQACLTPSECATGNCVDGSCCTSASCAAGQHCNFLSNPGTCLSDNGRTCTLGTQCGSGNCVDGYCCNSTCGGQCQACDIGGSLGTCIPVSGAVHGSRSACAGSGTCGAVCDGSDSTACHYPGSSKSCGSASCTAGVATPVGTCSGGGTCNQPTTSCGAYSCSGSICLTSCTLDTDCASTATYYCNAGTCTTKVANGGSCTKPSACTSGNCVSGVCCDTACSSPGYACTIAGSVGKCSKVAGTTCTTGSECASGNCVDSVCCNTACGSQCQACDVVGTVGTCVAVTGMPHGSRTACAGSGTCGSFCNGTDPSACHYPGSTTACGSASCASGIGTLVGGCSGAGACNQTTTPCGNYACGSTACKTSCTLDTDCASSAFWCTGGSCQLKGANGSTCSVPAGCASGNCVGGICCDSACTTAGYSCNLPGSPGHCTKANGTACTAGSECGSGNCVDGVCCDTACGGACQACDVGGSVGKCTAVVGAPHGTRPACSGTGAGTKCGPTCDGVTTGSCTYPSSSTTCGAATCTDGSSLSTYTQIGACSGSGSCTAGSGDCGTFKCSSTTCGTSCTTKSQCSSGNYCDTTKGICVPISGLGTACTDPTACPSGFCIDKVCCEASCSPGYSCDASPSTRGRCRKLNGVACAVDAECGSGHCVDGFCCNGTCTAPCEACNVPGKEGTCSAIVGQPKTGHPACSTTPTDLTCGLSCNGTDSFACHNALTTVACGVASCAGGIETDVSTCDGSGACKTATKTCGVYSCGTTACLSTCTIDDECSKGNFCKSGSCVAAQALGETCTKDIECASGHCADSSTGKVCCTVASCGSGAACAGPGPAVGTCLIDNAAKCKTGTECASGHCVDGVCCDKACDGQCEACDITGSEGTCTPATGTPHGARSACDTLSATDCAKTKCDGAVRDKCAGFANGATTSCGADSCTVDKRFQKHGACDGKGGCAMPDPAGCIPFACDTAGKACFTACTKDDDCADTYKCDTATSKCVQGSTCSADNTSSTSKAGVTTNCAPYTCGPDGNCQKQCATSADCVAGTSCDTTLHACIVVQTPDAAASGCGCSTPGSSPDDDRYLLALGGLALALGLKRRRDRRLSQ